MLIAVSFFFFQAEDGIRDLTVTGVQTCALPICMRRVNFRLDHDVILAASEGRFRSIRLVVAGGDLELFDVKITFGDGETFSPATRLYFKENSRSRTIDLPGAARIIRRIDFYYRSVPGGGQGKASVHVYGRR